MTSGVPAPASVDLFNKLIRLPGSSKQEIGQIEFRLRALQKKKPNDLRTTVALLQALTMLGKTSEAIDKANTIWQAVNWLDTDVQLTFFGNLVDLGMFDHAKELAASLTDKPGLRANPEFLGLIIVVAVGGGDLDLLRTATNLPLGPEISRRIESFMEELQRLELDSHFEQYQANVRNVMYGHQCSYLSIFLDAEAPELSVYIYVNRGREARRLLENEIDDASTKYCVEQGLDPGLFVPLITTHVLDISARHPLRIN